MAPCTVWAAACVFTGVLEFLERLKKHPKTEDLEFLLHLYLKKIAFYACHSFVIYEQICFANKDKSYLPMEKKLINKNIFRIVLGPFQFISVLPILN